MRASLWTLLAASLVAPGLGCKQDARPPPAEADPSPALQPPCVYFEDLRAFLPAGLAGFKLVRDEGSTGKYGEVSVSEAERVFRVEAAPKPGSGEEPPEDGRQVSVRIVDTTMGDRLGKAIREAAADALKRGNDTPTAAFTGADTVGFVRFDPGEQKAEANLLVGGRYVVAVSSLGFDGTDEVRRIASGLNLAGLSKLR